MEKTTKLGLYLIDEGTPLTPTLLNENYSIMETALNTDLTKIVSGALADNDVLNTNFQIIDNAWLDTSDATASASTILSGYTAYVKGSKVTGAYIPPSGVQLTVSTYCSISNPLYNGMPILSFYVPGVKTTNTLINFCALLDYYYMGSGDYNGNPYHGLVGGVIRSSWTLSEPYTSISGTPGQTNGFTGGSLARIWIPQDNYIYVDSAFVLHGGNFSANALTNISASYFEATWY